MTFATSHASEQLRDDINVTPLIDVLFVLLILFMVIAPVLPHGLAAALPQRPVTPNARADASIVVQILSGRDGVRRFKINQDNVSIQELASRLSSILWLRADKAMFVKADGDLDFSTIVMVMDIGKGAGAEHIGLLTSKDSL
ncbi:MAG TPA: biopolymer transporter ExbD [Terracidiphilus sp.]|nr:biopolymer transporter ExbD [Terracidiphilus sp.]